MLENVKKCKNFLATLIKLASSGPQAPQMGQNVKNLVQNLLVRPFFKESLLHLYLIFDMDLIILLFLVFFFFFLTAEELDLWPSTSELL